MRRFTLKNCVFFLVLAVLWAGCQDDPSGIQDQASCSIDARTSKGTELWDWSNVEFQEELEAVAAGPNGFYMTGNVSKASADGRRDVLEANPRGCGFLQPREST